MKSKNQQSRLFLLSSDFLHARISASSNLIIICHNEAFLGKDELCLYTPMYYPSIFVDCDYSVLIICFEITVKQSLNCVKDVTFIM